MSKSRIIAWSVWVIASIFYAYQYILRVLPNIMLNDIMEQFNIDAATFGQFSGIYYIGYSLMHIPIGILLDRYGARKVMTVCILLSAAGLLPLIYAEHWIYPIVGRLMIGMGSSAAILGVFKIVRMTFSEERFPRMLSFSVTIGLIGAIYGGAPVSYMLENLGFHSVVKILAFSALILAAVTYWIVPEQREESQGSSESVMANIKEVLTNRFVIGSCLFAGLMVGPMEGFADVWGTAFLKQVYGFDSALAASLPSMIYIGMCFGAPALSIVAEKMKSNLMAIIGAGIIMAVCFFLMLAFKLPVGILSFCFVIVGVSCAYQILAIYQATTYVPEKVAGLTTAVANMIIMIFGYAFHTAIGSTINAMGGANQSGAFIYGIMVVPIALCAGTAGYVFLYVLEKAKKGKLLAAQSIE